MKNGAQQQLSESEEQKGSLSDIATQVSKSNPPPPPPLKKYDQISAQSPCCLMKKNVIVNINQPI